MASGARYRVINKKIFRKGILYFPLLLSSSKIFCLSILQPTNNEMKIPPTGMRILEVILSNRAKKPYPNNEKSFHIPNEKDESMPNNAMPKEETIAAFARDICNSSVRKATITSSSEMVEVKEAKASKTKNITAQM